MQPLFILQSNMDKRLQILADYIETVLFACLILIFGMLTIKEGNIWLNEKSLWEDVVKKSPHKARPHLNLGMAYKNAGYLERAIEEFKESFRVDPKYAKGRSNLGVAYFEKGLIDKGLEEIKAALAVDPNLPEAHNNLGIIYTAKKEYEKAINAYKTAVAINPE